MSTRSTTRTTTSGRRSGSAPTRRVFLRNAKIRSKLAVILVVPVLAIVTLAALRLVDAGNRLREATMARALTTVSVDASELAQQLQAERMAAAALLTGPHTPTTAYTRQGALTSAGLAVYRHDRAALPAVPADVARRLDRVDRQLSALDRMRTQVVNRQGVSAAEAVLRYGLIVDDIVAYQEAVSQAVTDPVLADEMRAVAAFARAKSQVGEEQAVVYMALKATRYGPEQLAAVLATLTAQQESLAAFDGAADPWQRGLVASTVTGAPVAAADRLANQLSHAVGQRPALNAEDAARTIGAAGDLMRGTQRRLDAQALADAVQLSSRMSRRTLAEAGLLLAILLVVAAPALALARSLARSLNRLREGALAVANHGLPAAVARLRQLPDSPTGGLAAAAAAVAEAGHPVAVDGRDEIGQVAQAFNAVHREAVRIAAEQAAMRTRVSAMFLNLARRSQSLVDRMIGELDQIEHSEEDPRRLARLFQLDHLATRMRRADENLLILAGADSSPARREDAALADVLRAAQSEIELYDRVEFGTVDPDVWVRAPAVNDVVRLLAELMDNATGYAPPSATALADARRIGDHVLIQIEDRGLGIPAAQMEAINSRLAQPRTVDVTAFRMMGLAVVARLAHRHGIRVELRDNPYGGTVANVMLPAAVLVLPRSRPWVPHPDLPRGLPLLDRPTMPAQTAMIARRPTATWTEPAPLAVAGSGWTGGTGEILPVRRRPAESWTVRAAELTASAPPAPRAVTAVPAAPAVPDTDGAVDAPSAGAPAGMSGELPIHGRIDVVWFADEEPVGGRSAAPGPRQGVPAGPRPVVPGSRTATPGGADAGRGGPFRIPGSPEGAPRPRQAPGHGSSRRMLRDPDEPAVWRTAADEGWRAAARAAAPNTQDTTEVGLPKRVPLARLVPGGVQAAQDRVRTRRTPDEVRGLLSAYQSGVRRGRTTGTPIGGDPGGTRGEAEE